MGKFQPHDKVLEVVAGLQANFKTLPFSFLYNKRGSELFDEITALKEYYLFEAEKKMLDSHANEIASYVDPGSVIVELGCGSAQKTARLLSAVPKSCTFVGIDVSKSALLQARKNLERNFQGEVDFIEAEYMEGLKQVKKRYPRHVLCVIWLGSSIGNLSQKEAISFLKDIRVVCGSRCLIFLCTDIWKDPDTLISAYHDSKGITESFIRNGVQNALKFIGYEHNTCEEKSCVYEVEINKKLRQVEMYIKFMKGLEIGQWNIYVRPEERVLVEISRKFTWNDIQTFANESGFRVQASWHASTYGCQWLFPPEEALLRCWGDTDNLLNGVDWKSKPISFRHPFSFYCGHISAFAKLKLLDKEPVSNLDIMFSRGIDPILLSPSCCHSHPDIPDEWPQVDEIKSYVQATRKMIMDAIHGEKLKFRLVHLALEHEYMHQETLSYMLVQEQKRKFENNYVPSKNHFVSANLSVCAEDSCHVNPEVCISPGEVVLGATDPTGTNTFLWDNEYPSVRSNVDKKFWVSSKPVSVRQYISFIVDKGYERQELWDATDFEFMKKQGMDCPATWSWCKGQIYVHTTKKSQEWMEVAEKPVYVSLSEAKAFCKWAGCRIMSEAEYQRLVDVNTEYQCLVDANRRLVDVNTEYQRLVDANQRLVDANAEYQRLVDANGEIGRVEQLKEGGWEWTDTVFAPFPDFRAMEEYPQYSSDFFDGLHYVLKGSSPATHPSMIRGSFRNFYQRQYPYVFAKFRCCK